jgi:hypothetical protein
MKSSASAVPPMAASITAELFTRSRRATAIDVLHAATALYTQDPIVVQLLDQISWPAGAGALLDTSCGDGAFLHRALERVLDAHPTLSDQALCARLEGWEIHFFAASEARNRLRRVLIEHGREASRASALASQMIRCGDFLTEGPRHGHYQAIVGNPPYLRMLNVPDPLRGEYETVLPEYARADLLHSFLDRCAALLARDGELAMVTADRWLFNEGAARVREVVGQHFGLASLTRLEAASAFYRPKLRRAGTLPRIHPVAVVLKAHREAVQPIGRAPIYPGECALRSAIHEVLGDVAEVRLAPWLGTAGIFLVDAEVSSTWPAGTTVPAIDTDDLKGGVLTPPRRRAILTRPEEAPVPQVLAHLDRELPRMCARGRSAIHWMPPEPFHRFDLSRPSLLVPRIAKTLRPVRVPAGILPVNHNLSIVRAGSMSLDDLEALLNGSAAKEWIAHRAPRLENGYRSLTTRLLRTLPVFRD